MSKQQQSFDDLFKTAFENHEVTPPTHLWDNIERELPPSGEDQVFKRAFQDYEVEPPPVVWQNVQRRLPINLVLRRHLVMFSQVAAVLLLLMFGMLLHNELKQAITEDDFMTTAEVKTRNNANESEQATVPSNEITDVLTTTQQTNQTTVVQSQDISYPTNNQSNYSSIKNNNDLVPVLRTTTIPSTYPEKAVIKGREALLKGVDNDNTTTDKVKELKSKTAIPIAQADIINLDNTSLLNSAIAPIIIPSDEILVSNALSGFMERLSLEKRAQDNVEKQGQNSDKQFRKEALTYQGYYVSATTQWGGSSIMNSTIKDQLGSAVTSALSLGKSFGLSAGKKVSDRWSLEVGLNYSAQGSRYREINNGKRITDASLTYIQVPLTAKYRKNQLSSKRLISFSYVGGLQYGRSIATPALATTLNGEPVSTPNVDNNLFVTNEIGAIGGIDLDLYLTQNWSFTGGFRAGLGTDLGQPLNSINTLVGLRAGVNYRFTAK